MRRSLCLPAAVLLSLQLTACMASTQGPRARVRSTEISAAELRATDATNVYDAIQRLRPGFFSRRGATSFLAEPTEPIVVIVNQLVMGGVAELQHIEPGSVRSIRRLNSVEVYNLIGRSAPAGGIEVLFGP